MVCESFASVAFDLRHLCQGQVGHYTKKAYVSLIIGSRASKCVKKPVNVSIGL